MASRMTITLTGLCATGFSATTAAPAPARRAYRFEMPYAARQAAVGVYRVSDGVLLSALSTHRGLSIGDVIEGSWDGGVEVPATGGPPGGTELGSDEIEVRLQVSNIS